MDKTFSPSYSSSQITYVEAEAVEFSRFCFRFRFHRKKTASSFRFRFHIPGVRVWRRTEFEILSTQIKKNERFDDNSKASQRQQANNYCPQRQLQTQQNSHNAKDEAETNKQQTITLTIKQ